MKKWFCSRSNARMVLFLILEVTSVIRLVNARSRRDDEEIKLRPIDDDEIDYTYQSRLSRANHNINPNTPDIDLRIIGGGDANTGDYPWFARAVTKSPFYYNSFWGCGGSLITAEFILTAAHCNWDIDVSFQIGALCSPYGPSGSDNCHQYTEMIDASSIFNHPDYNSVTTSHDFALIQLKTQSSINPVAVDEEDLSTSYTGGENLWTIGLGRTNYYSDTLPDHLKHVEVSYITNEECNKPTSYGGDIDSTMMCASDFMEDSCKGDSGGPLYDRENEKLVGIVSWGIGCAFPAYPGVYSRIASEWDWIREIVCENHSIENIPDFCEGYTRKPTAKPTSSPTYRQCLDDEHSVLLQLETDDYPYETSWSITNIDTSITFVEYDSYDDDPSKYEYYYCLPSACYKFEIRDSYGDGISAPFGYSLTVDGIIRLSSFDDAFGDFGFTESTLFGCIPTKSPTKSPSISQPPSDAPSIEILESAIINNGLIMLGIRKEGHLNAPGDPDALIGIREVGLRYKRNGGWYDSTAYGCTCEGFGVSAKHVTGSSFFGGANDDQSIVNLSNAYLTTDGVSATTKVVVDDTIGVTHEFKPSPHTENLYEVKVTYENLGATTLTELRYRRVMDWDIPPAPFSECVSVLFSSVPESLEYITDNGFEGVNPLYDVSNNGIVFNCPGGSGCPIFDSGPNDHGILFQFLFKNENKTSVELLPGETFSFDIFYGAADNKVEADNVLASVGVEIASYGFPPSDSVCSSEALGVPNVFILGFRGVGGTSMISTPSSLPSLSLTPTSLPSSSPTTACFDDLDFKHNSVDGQSCHWVGSDEFRRNNLCSNNILVQRSCSLTCGLCCKDVASFTFIQGSTGRTRDCAWIAKTGKIKRCNAKAGDGVLIEHFCPKACGKCRSEVSRGSTLPSESPTLENSQSPSSEPTTSPSTAHIKEAPPTVSSSAQCYSKPMLFIIKTFLLLGNFIN